jgi:hypothetical protein
MAEQNIHTVELTIDEIHSLIECLAKLRNGYTHTLSSSHENTLFAAASDLHRKLGKLVQPDTDVTIDDHLGKRVGSAD